MNLSETKFLNNINYPADLRKINLSDLKTVCSEVREYLIDVVSKTGGHLGAGLGVVELTVALHYTFETPIDKLIWDVGHQGYPHKILTGRKHQMYTLRQFGGLSGFLKRDESEYDVFGAGHANTAISAGLGIAAARDFNQEKYKVVSIVGDGSLTGGMAYEALNNAGLLKKNIIVILNDNKMNSLSSLQPSKWAVQNYFTEILANPTFNKFKADVWNLTGRLDTFGDRIRRVTQKLEKGVKSIITPGMLFEAFGFRYFGPVNGHNVVKLVELFNHVKDFNGPILIHVMTEKGKGYKHAENEITRYHGVTPFDKTSGKFHPSKTSTPSYTSIFGNALTEICSTNPKVVGITAAMADGTGLTILQNKYPDKFFDVGIAEQHAVTFAAGLATEGLTPVVAIYSSFLQRGFDQIIHDIAIQKLNVVFVLDRGGLVGADGPTHHGNIDLSYLRCIPNMVVMAPKDENELRNMLFTAIEFKNGPITIRYPRGNAIGVKVDEKFSKIEIGKGEIVKDGNEVAILAIGNMVQNAIAASEILNESEIYPTVVNMRFAKPIDSDLLLQIAKNHNKIITVEDNSIVGGFGSAIIEELSKLNITNVNTLCLGIPDEFITHGKPEELYKLISLDANGIAEKIKLFLLNDIQEQIKI